ncbi:MAG: hypothetical protein ABIK44_05440 [candidate division WOR-3 bacterium]
MAKQGFQQWLEHRLEAGAQLWALLQTESRPEPSFQHRPCLGVQIAGQLSSQKAVQLPHEKKGEEPAPFPHSHTIGPSRRAPSDAICPGVKPRKIVMASGRTSLPVESE